MHKISKARTVQVRYLESIKGGMVQFFTPQTSNETVLVQIPANTIDDLFVHKTHTDQLLVVKGEFVIVILIDKKYQYIALTDKRPAVLIIPPGVLHGAINFSDEPAVVVNAVLRHHEPHPMDYVTRGKPFTYDLEAAKAALAQLQVSI